MLHIPVRRGAAILLAGSLALIALPGVASAHAELQTASPGDKSTVTEPVTVVSGLYTEAMTPDGSSIVVKDASGATVARGTVDPANTSRMVATPATPLGTAAYVVAWTSVALDGHVERGTWTFKVAVAPTPSPTTPVPTAAPSAATSATPAATTSPAPTPVPATPVPTTAPTPAPSADGSTTGSGGDVVLPIIIALIVLGAGAAYLFSRRGQPPTDPT